MHTDVGGVRSSLHYQAGEAHHGVRLVDYEIRVLRVQLFFGAIVSVLFGNRTAEPEMGKQ